MAAMADAAAPTRVVIADDDVLLREGLASLLERSRFEVVGQCGNATELLQLVRERRPDLAIVDIRMPPTHTTEGLDAARTIRHEMPHTAILLLSAHVDVEHAMDLLASGERTGYLLKSRVTDVVDFVATLGRIAKGASVVDPALVQELVAARRVQDPLSRTRERRPPRRRRSCGRRPRLCQAARSSCRDAPSSMAPATTSNAAAHARS
jgi:DNA-binding NarL/FixJ family response regulator